MTRQVPLAALVLLATATLASAEDPVSIDIKDRRAGETAVVEQVETIISNGKLVDQDGKAIKEQNNKVVITYLYRESYQVRENGKAPTRIRREYEKAQITHDGKTIDRPFHDKIFVIERKEGKYHYAFENGDELTGQVKETPDLEFDTPTPQEKYCLEREVLPDKPVACDKPWTVNMKPIIATINGKGLNYNEDRAEGKGVLRKVRLKDGKRFGTIHVQMTTPIKSFGSFWPLAISLEDGSKSEIEMDMDVCIDGQTETGVYKTKKTYTIIAGDGKDRVGLTEAFNLGPLTVKRNADSDKGQVTLTLVKETVKTIRELPKK